MTGDACEKCKRRREAADSVDDEMSIRHLGVKIKVFKKIKKLFDFRTICRDREDGDVAYFFVKLCLSSIFSIANKLSDVKPHKTKGWVLLEQHLKNILWKSVIKLHLQGKVDFLPFKIYRIVRRGIVWTINVIKNFIAFIMCGNNLSRRIITETF